MVPPFYPPSFRGAPISAFTRVFDALWARTRNPEQRVWLWIPGPLAALASRNDGETLHKIPQSSLLEKRVDGVAELAHALLVAREADQHAVEAGARQRGQRIDDLRLGADH